MDFIDFIWVIVFAVGLIQGLFLCFIIFTLPGSNKSAMRLLALVVAGSALMIGEEMLEISRWHLQIPHVIGSTMLLPLLMGPWVFLYSQAIAKNKQRLTWTDYLHFLPFAFFALSTSCFYLNSPAEKLDALAQGGICWLDNGMTVLTIFKAVHLFLYLFLSLYFLRQHQQSKRHSAPTQDQTLQIVWAYRILAAMTGFMVIMYGLLSLGMLGYEPAIDADQFGSMVMTVFIYLLAFAAIKYPVVISGSGHFREIQVALEKERVGRPQYQFSSLDIDRKQTYLDHLLTYMEDEKPYRDSNIRMDDIANALDIPSHHLSQIINELLEVNFNEFINAYRVEEVKQKLRNPAHAHLNILALAFDAGFNSKTSFNRIFKQFTGKTPSLYRTQGGVS